MVSPQDVDFLAGVLMEERGDDLRREGGREGGRREWVREKGRVNTRA